MLLVPLPQNTLQHQGSVKKHCIFVHKNYLNFSHVSMLLVKKNIFFHLTPNKIKFFKEIEV